MAEDTEHATLEDAVPPGLLENYPGFLTFTIENNNFGDGSDENYTNDVRFDYFDTSADLPWFASLLDRHLPIFEISDTTSVYYSFGQNLYTPEDIEVSTPDPKDRPYAAFLYASAGLTTLKEIISTRLRPRLASLAPGRLAKKFRPSCTKYSTHAIRTAWITS